MTEYYHVTSLEDAQSILKEGFEGGWGDIGYGVYLFDDLFAAENYAHDGGWDGRLETTQTVIIAIKLEDRSDEVSWVIPDPEWPNPEDYEHVLFHPMKEDDSLRWRPTMRLVQDDAPSPM